MEVKLRLLQYYLLVWETGYLDTKEYYQKDRKSLIGNIVTGSISAIASPLLLYRFGGTEALSNLWLVALVIFISALIGAIGWIVVLLLWNVFVIAPVKIYRIKELEANRTTWRDVEILPYEFPETSRYGVGLNFISDKPNEYDFYITHPEAKIASITQNDGVIHNLNTSLQFVYQYNENFIPTNTIYRRDDFKERGQETILAVAYCNDNQAWIEQEENEQDEKITVGKSHPAWITIEMTAKLGVPMQKYSMDKLNFSCRLAYSEKGKRFVIDKVKRA